VGLCMVLALYFWKWQKVRSADRTVGKTEEGVEPSTK
jgi:hypothetical protein